MNIVPCLPIRSPCGRSQDCRAEAGCLRHPGGRVNQRCPTAWQIIKPKPGYVPFLSWIIRTLATVPSSLLLLGAVRCVQVNINAVACGAAESHSYTDDTRLCTDLPPAKKSTHSCPRPFDSSRGYELPPKVGLREACGP